MKKYILMLASSLMLVSCVDTIILPDDKTVDEAYAIAEEIRSKVDEYQFPEIYHLSCSIGVTEITPEDEPQTAFDRLDKAMYASKQNGRNQVTKI